MKRLLIIIAGLFSIAYGQRYQTMPAEGYGPIKRMRVDSVLNIPIGDTTRKRNLSDGKDSGQIRWFNGSLYVYNGSYWSGVSGGGSGTTPNLDQVTTQGNTTANDVILNGSSLIWMGDGGGNDAGAIRWNAGASPSDNYLNFSNNQYYTQFNIKPERISGTKDYYLPDSSGTIALMEYLPSGGSNVGDSLVRALDSLAAHNTRIGALEASTGTGVPTYFDIIATGQSNMVNNDITLGTWTYTTNARVQSLASNYRFATANPALNNIDYRGGITAERNNIGFAFAREWAKENTRDTIRILDRAKGSQPSSEWTPKTTGNGEITATNGMLDTLVNTLNNAPANFNAKVVLYHQGEADESANTTWFLSNLTEIYDTLKTHAKVADDYYMIVGYPSTTYPNIIATMDSIYNRGMKDLGGRNILVVPISTGANSTIDGTHWTNETIDQIGQMDYYHYKWRLTGQKQRTDSAATIWKSGASGAYRQTQTWVNQGGTTTRPYDAVFGAYSPATAPTLARFAYLNTGTVNEAQSLRFIRLAARQIAIWHESDNGSSVQTFRNAMTFDDSALFYRNSAGANRFTFGDNVTSTSQPFSSSSNITSSGTISGALYYGSTSGTSAVPIQVRTSTSGAGSGSYIQFTTTSVNTGLIGATFENSPSNRGDLVFRPAADASNTYTERMRVRGDGIVAIGTSSPNTSAILDVTSTTKGFLPPRMTAAQASAISTPAEGLLVYVTDTNGTFTSKGWWGYNGTTWEKLNN